MEVIELREDSDSTTTSIPEDDSQFKSAYFSPRTAALRKGRYICPYCTFPFHWPGNLTEHVKYFHRKGKGALCKICDKSFETLDILRQHVKAHLPEGSKECPSCHLSLGQLSLDLHYSHCPSRLSSPTPGVVGKFLQGSYEPLSATDDITMLYWKPNDKVETAGKQAAPVSTAIAKPLVSNNNNNSSSSSSHNDSLVPSGSTALYKTINLPSNKYSSPHLLCSFINSQTPNAGEETSKCPLCATDVYQNTIIAHLIDIHEMSFENVICVYTALNKKFTRVVLCKWCKREFKKSSSCTAHSRCCYRRPTFLNNKCSQCQGLFTTYEEYLAHYCCKEYKFENAQCSACKILLNNLLTFDFKNHEKICKNDEGVVLLPEAKPSSIPSGISTRGRQKEFICPRCSSVFLQKSLLDNHCLTCCYAPDQLTSLDQVDDVSQLQHSCQHCGQCFLTAAMLTTHSCDVIDTDTGALMVSEPIIPLVEPPQALYRRASRGRPRGRSRGGPTRRRGRPPGRGRGRPRRTFSDTDSDSDFLPEEMPFKKARLDPINMPYENSFDNGHMQPAPPPNDYYLDPAAFTTTANINAIVNSAKIQPACMNCDSTLHPHTLVCPTCGLDNSTSHHSPVRKVEDPEPIVIDLDKMNEDDEEKEEESSHLQSAVTTTLVSEEDSGIKCHYEDFSYQTINTFHGFVPLNQSHYICSKCFNNVSSLSLLAEHLATKHDLKITDSLRIGRMRGAFVTAPVPETIT